MLDAHYSGGTRIDAAAFRGIMLSPILAIWRYEVEDAAAFRVWLTGKDIVLNADRFTDDNRLETLRYFGTYSFSEGDRRPETDCVNFTTFWGYGSHAAVNSVDDLVQNRMQDRSTIQDDYLDFVDGLMAFVKAGGSLGVQKDFLVSAKDVAPKN